LKKKRATDEMKKLREKRKKHNKVLGAEGATLFTPYLTNVTADPMTTGTLKVYLLKDKPLVIGAPGHEQLMSLQDVEPGLKHAVNYYYCC
jgi:hypothetical protein